MPNTIELVQLFKEESIGNAKSFLLMLSCCILVWILFCSWAPEKTWDQKNWKLADLYVNPDFIMLAFNTVVYFRMLRSTEKVFLKKVKSD